MSMKIGINGLGRIGRALIRALSGNPAIELVAVNDVAEPEAAARLIRRDSVRGLWHEPVRCEDGVLTVGDRRIATHREPSLADVPWERWGCELVVEATGRATDRERAASHLAHGVERVVVSGACDGADATLCFGVNHESFRPRHDRVLSAATCTTHALASVLSVVERRFGVELGNATTIHCYTPSQPLLDAAHPDPRRSRAAGLSLIPTGTSAERALRHVLPELDGRLLLSAVRAPVPDVSAVDFSLSLKRGTTTDEVVEVLREESGRSLDGLLGVCDEPLVSIDHRGSPCSAVVDLPLTRMLGSHFLRLFAWYDNEWGYTSRLVGLLEFLAGAGRETAAPR